MMSSRTKGAKGWDLEELLRAYFLRAGFYAVRSVILRVSGEDLTDVDIWLYERPTGSSRRRQIVDAKSKSRPKAIERFLWTKGLKELLDVDGAYVATTDARPMLRSISKKLGISILDGTDLNRISGSDKVLYPERLSEEELLAKLVKFDRLRRDRTLQGAYADVKSSLIDAFGAGAVNRGLDAVSIVGGLATSSHPNGEDAEIAVRICYFVASVVAISIDFVLSEFSFRSAEERREALLNAIRYGTPDLASGKEKFVVAIELLRKYGPQGEASGRRVEAELAKEIQEIPAEIIADHVVKHIKQDDLFQIARRLEHYAFSRDLASFDRLPPEEKSFFATVLDFANVDRMRFANAWLGSRAFASGSTPSDQQLGPGPLFSK
jgi:hypothetical protein